MRKLIARVLGLSIPTKSNPYLTPQLIYSISTKSEYRELTSAIAELERMMASFFNQEARQYENGILTSEDWTELTQLTTLWTIARIERDRRQAL
jgi:hypothetical protein